MFLLFLHIHPNLLKVSNTQHNISTFIQFIQLHITYYNFKKSHAHTQKHIPEKYAKMGGKHTKRTHYTYILHMHLKIDLKTYL